MPSDLALLDRDMHYLVHPDNVSCSKYVGDVRSHSRVRFYSFSCQFYARVLKAKCFDCWLAAQGVEQEGCSRRLALTLVIEGYCDAALRAVDISNLRSGVDLHSVFSELCLDGPSYIVV